MKRLLLLILIPIFMMLSGCSENVITDIFFNQITAKDRLDSAYAQAQREYGSNTQLVMIYGKNVDANGKTNITALDILLNGDLDSIGTWLYIFKSPADTSFRVYAPNPVPGARDCVNLTRYFDPYSILGLITDTTAANIVAGALDLVVGSNISITTHRSSLIDSDFSIRLADTTSSIIKFNSNFDPGISNINGESFFSSGTQFERNMFLIPAAGTLNLPNYISELFGFPADVWIVNYKKQSGAQQQNLILATVPQANQTMGLQGFSGFSSKVINISKFFN